MQAIQMAITRQSDRIIVILLLSFTLFLFACPPDDGDGQENKEIYNYIVLTDLSDRIHDSIQAERDKQLIKTIFQQFRTKVKLRDYYVNSKDAFSVIALGSNSSHLNRLEYEDSLRINLAALSMNKKRTSVENFENQMDQVLNNLYKDATSPVSPNAQEGSNLWQYFNQNAATDLKDSVKNFIFILTDGYLEATDNQSSFKTEHRAISSDFLIGLRKPDWRDRFDREDYGLLAVNQKFDSLSILILEVEPKDDFLEELGLLQKMWSKWLNEMNVSRYQIISKSSLGEVREDISDFLQMTAVPVGIAGSTEEDTLQEHRESGSDTLEETPEPEQASIDEAGKELVIEEKETMVTKNTVNQEVKPKVAISDYNIPNTLAGCFQSLSDKSLPYQVKKEIIKNALQYFDSPEKNVLIIGKHDVQTGRETIGDYLNKLSIQKYNVSILAEKTNEAGKIYELSVREN